MKQSSHTAVSSSHLTSSRIHKRGWGNPDGMQQLVAGEGAVDEMCLSPHCLPPAGAGGGSKKTSAFALSGEAASPSRHCRIRRRESSQSTNIRV